MHHKIEFGPELDPQLGHGIKPINHRDGVIARIRESLPEFCQRNGVVLSEKVLDNLAHWVSGVVPSGMARTDCTGNLPQCGAEYSFACACTGMCQRWYEVGDLDNGYS